MCMSVAGEYYKVGRVPCSGTIEAARTAPRKAIPVYMKAWSEGRKNIRFLFSLYSQVSRV